MAGLAVFAHRGLQQGMVKVPLLTKTPNPSMIAMAGHTFLTAQLLVKRHCGQRFDNGKTRGRQAPNFIRLVASLASRLIGPKQRRMAGKTIGFQILVAGNQLPGSDHQVRVNKYQHHDDNQIDGEKELEDSAHDQPQNRKMLTT